ncbi:hypothetical protein N7504_003550 [Penicillium tannophilum]|nr:hypothetical protein N7504_003550 [Penicillium tannophilum]
MSIPIEEPSDEEYRIVKDFLQPKSTIFAKLLKVQDEVKRAGSVTTVALVWKSPKADEYFKNQKARAVQIVSEEQRANFFSMMTKIGDYFQDQEKLIPPPSKRMNFDVLDLCMAPGGFSATALKYNRFAQVYAISLPRDEGGLEIYLPNWQENKRLRVKLLNLTMLSAELGFPTLASQDHPSASKFSNHIPYAGRQFDLIFCDGHVLPTTEPEDNLTSEIRRLADAQIVMALQRIKSAGTIVVLLHQVYNPRVLRLLKAFENISQITLFKPPFCHAKRTSFYLVAKNVDPLHEVARRLVRDMRNSWRVRTTNAFDLEIPEGPVESNEDEENMEDIMQSFGGKLISLAEPVWKIQTEAMEKAFLGGKK